MLGLLAGPAAAATTWTVNPGGPVTGHSNRTALIDTTTGTFGIFCASSSLHGKFRSGHGLPGAGLGSVTAVSFSGGCFTLTSGHLPWKVNARSYTSTTGTTTGTITPACISSSPTPRSATSPPTEPVPPRVTGSSTSGTPTAPAS